MRLLLLIILLPAMTCAQTGLYNKGIFYISNSSDVVYIAGTVTNTASASFTNKGSFSFKGNLTNDQASMAIGSGTFFITGTSAQTINGTQPLNVFNLTTNNAAGITLTTNLNVSGTHTFSAGVITATSNYLIYQAGASYTGANDSRHVKGWVKKIGATDFSFPTGNGTYLRPISLLNLSVSSEFDAQYSGATYNPANVQSPIVSMNPNEYWTVNQVSGGSAQVQLNWDNSKIAFPNYVVADLRAAVYTGSFWTNAGGTATGTAATSGTITSGSITNFGRLSIGSTSFVVPLRFVTISAVHENASVKINWQTANEVAVQNYEVQRSTDGVSFSTIATIPAKNMNLQSYQHIDETISSSKLYYRIKANDQDGRSRYSNTVSLASDNIQKIELLTNPVHNTIQLVTQNLPVSVYNYHLVNAKGQVYKTGSFSCGGSSVVALPVFNITEGWYTLILAKPGEQKQFKILVQ
jgi:hypothetical protein